MIRRRLGSDFPLFIAFGERPAFLSAEDTAEATTEGRIKSIWAFLVRKALNFHRTLKPQEKVNFDLEDLLAELYVALAERDHKWSPDRGKYITFAGAIIDHELYAIRDKARTVESPRNASGRMKQYLREEEAGTITPRRLKTSRDIRRTGDCTAEIGPDRADLFSTNEEPASIVIRREDADDATEGLRIAIQQLAPDEAEVLVRLAGVFGRDRESMAAVALHLGHDLPSVRRIASRARRKVRKFLADTGRAPAEAA